MGVVRQTNAVACRLTSPFLLGVPGEEREREGGRQTDRQTDRQTERSRLEKDIFKTKKTKQKKQEEMEMGRVSGH